MKNPLVLILTLSVVIVFTTGCLNNDPEENLPNPPTGTEFIGNQLVATDAVLRAIPKEYIDKARKNLHIAYQHTSHGTQAARGVFGLPEFKPGDDVLFGITNKDQQANKLDFNDNVLSAYAEAGVDASDLSRNETAFIQATRNYLNDPANDRINVIMWSWCNIAGHHPEVNYLPGMGQLISEYGPGGSKIGSGQDQRENVVTFIFMTGHANYGGNVGDKKPKNQADLITEYCINNKQYCLDYYAIDTHDMEGKYWEDATDDGYSDAYGGNFYKDWQDAHSKGTDWYDNRELPGGNVVFGAHNSQHITANRKAFAMWWILARIAGWDGK